MKKPPRFILFCLFLILAFSFLRSNNGVALDIRLAQPQASVAPFAVSSTNPPGNSTNVSYSPIISIKFNRPLDPNTINTTNFYLSPSVVSGVSLSNDTVFFQPHKFLVPNSNYQLIISTGVADTQGNKLSSQFVLHFSTSGGQSPEPLGITIEHPRKGADKIPLGTRIIVGFNDVIDPASIYPWTLSLYPVGHPGEKVEVNFLPPPSGFPEHEIVFVPQHPLNPGTTYRATITDYPRSKSGMILNSDFTWEFSTWNSAKSEYPCPSGYKIEPENYSAIWYACEDWEHKAMVTPINEPLPNKVMWVCSKGESGDGSSDDNQYFQNFFCSDTSESEGPSVHNPGAEDSPSYCCIQR